MARLAYAAACRELSDRARSPVATYADEYANAGELVEYAAQLVGEAEEALRLAVVAERKRGCSWEQIGERLDVPRQRAHERYAAAEREFDQALLFPLRRGAGEINYSALPDGLDDPDRTATDLDAWVVRHAERWDADKRHGGEPVSAQLRGTTESQVKIDRIGAITRLADALIKRDLPAGVDALEARRDLEQRKVELYEQILSSDPRDVETERALRDARIALARFDDLKDDQDALQRERGQRRDDELRERFEADLRDDPPPPGLERRDD